MNKQEILIIGAGPAGLVAAMLLAKAGLKVTIIDHQNMIQREGFARLKTGESLPPAAYRLLQALDLWEAFEKGSHLKSYNNKSLWGSDQLAYTDFINNPPGYGWHLDRVEFEEMLLQKAMDAGATLLEATTLHTAELIANKWEVKWKTIDGHFIEKKVDFLIDASGRNSWLARRLGVKRWTHDHQLALVAFMAINNSFTDHSGLVETTPNGWWYSAKIPHNRMALTYLCQPNREQVAHWRRKKGFQVLVSKAPYTKKRIAQANGQLITLPKFVAAGGSVLKQTYGKQWIAIGDAAITYDPIASHGIMLAMVSARDAVEVMTQYFQEGNMEGFAAYQQLMHTSFQHYRQQRQQFYDQEQRFPNAIYWQRREYKSIFEPPLDLTS